MAQKNETTTKFKVDIADLKKGIQEACRQIKLANAEFKAAASGMDDWSKSADGISKKIEQLQTVLDAQKTILSNYEQQLELIKSQYGENSREADEMRIRIANQQAVINDTERSIRNYTTQLNNLQREQEASARAAAEQENAYDKLQKEMQDQQTELDRLKSEYASVVLEQGKESDEAKRLAGEIDTLSGELRDNQQALKAAEDAADDLDNTLEDMDPEETAGGFTVLKGALADLVAQGISKCIEAVKDFGKAIIEVGKSFDTEMSKVQAISGATAEEMETLRAKAKEMGESTKYTATEAGEAFEYMAMAGWKTEQMISGIDGILNLATASGEDLGTTSDIVTDALTAFGLSASDAGRFADVLAAASSNANTNVSMMGASFKYVAPVAGSLGYSIEDTAIALGLMANAGIKADMAGTSLRNLFQRMAKPTDESEAAMQRLGLALYDDTGRMYSLQEIMDQLREGFVSINMPLEDYNAALDELDAALAEGSIKQGEYEKSLEELNLQAFGAEGAEKARAAAMLGGARAMSGLLAIANASEEDYNKLTDAIYGSAGAAQEMADIMMDNLEGDMTKFQSRLQGIQLELYEKMEPALREGAKALGVFLDALQWLVDHGTEVVTVLGSIAAGVAAYIAYTTALKVMELGWVGITAALKASAAAQWLMNAAMAANPIGLVIAAITALVAAFVILWNKSEKFRQFWIDLWEALKELCGDAWEAIKEFFVGAWEALQKAWSGITSFFSGLWEGIKDIWSGLTSFFVGLYEKIKAIFINAAKWVDETIFQPIKTLFQPVIDFFTTAWNIIGELAVGCWNVITAAWGAVGGWFSEKLEAVKGFFSSAWDNIKTKASDAWSKTKENWSTAASWFDEHVAGPVKDKLSTAWEKVKEDQKESWEKTKETWSVVSDWFGEHVASPIKEKFSDAWAKTKEGASSAWDTVKTTFAPMANWFKDKFSEAWNNVKNVFSTGGKIFDGIKDGIVNAFKSVVNGIIRAINKIIAVPFNAINNTLENLRNAEILGTKPFEGLVSRFDIPQIPELATGGVLRKGQVGLLEGDGAEAVVPLDQNKKWIAATANALRQALTKEGIIGQAAAGTKTNVYNYEFVQNNSSPKALSRLDIYRNTQAQIELAKGVL